jgi:hypothetical protein
MIGIVIGFCWAWGAEVIRDYKKVKNLQPKLKKLN